MMSMCVGDGCMDEEEERQEGGNSVCILYALCPRIHSEHTTGYQLWMTSAPVRVRMSRPLFSFLFRRLNA